MNIEVKVNGKAYPCRPTMGAMLRFKKETGKEVTEIRDNAISELCTYLYCCVASASAADGIDFNLTLEQFTDALAPDDMNEWVKQLQGKSAEDNGAEKKR